MDYIELMQKAQYNIFLINNNIATELYDSKFSEKKNCKSKNKFKGKHFNF